MVMVPGSSLKHQRHVQ